MLSTRKIIRAGIKDFCRHSGTSPPIRLIHVPRGGGGGGGRRVIGSTHFLLLSGRNHPSFSRLSSPVLVRFASSETPVDPQILPGVEPEEIEEDLTENLERTTTILGDQLLGEELEDLSELDSEHPVNVFESVHGNVSQPAEEDHKLEEVIPEPPVPPPAPDVPTQGIAEQAQTLAEPTFQSLGLGGWTPSGLVQTCFEFLHINCGLPWWGCIATGTLVVRILLFPLVIQSQRNAARLNNNMPRMQEIQAEMTDARQMGDKMEAAKKAHELMEFMQEKKLNPVKNLLVPLAQIPIFLSFFIGLRGMTKLPVESLREGGLYWFTDLTVPDEFYLLPLITSTTLLATIELGTDSARMNQANAFVVKYVMRAIPVVIFPFIMNFPAGILVYWCSTNFISLGQVAILRIPVVREYFKIEKIVYKPSVVVAADGSKKKKGFVTEMKQSWSNMQLSRQLGERERIDEYNFNKAGRGAVKKTFKYDPTKFTAVQAKKRD